MKRLLAILSLAILTLACQKLPDDVPTVTISLSPQSLVLEIGETHQITATVAPSGKTLSWTSDDTGIASVDNNGNVKGVAPGTATITASADKSSQTCEVTVTGGANLLGAMSSDAEILNGAGGETVVDINTSSASFTVTSNCDWLTCEPLQKQVVIKTEKNSSKVVRTGAITISDGAKKHVVAIKQRPYIFSRSQVGSNTITNAIKITYGNTKLTRVYIVLPAPKTNQYQDISDCTVTPGTIEDCPDGMNSYTRTDITEDFPKSGSNFVTESFHATAYTLEANLNIISDIPEYDPESAPCKMYLGMDDYGFIDPTHEEIASVSDNLWNKVNGNLILYARRCYEWTANHMTYGNSYTGLHTIEELMRTKKGDCGNFSSVFISLLRAKDIPARHIVMIAPQEHDYHVRAEFYIPAYGWIPADPTFYNSDRSGDYFGRFTGTYVVMSLGINNICKGYDNSDQVMLLLQTYYLWYWYSSGDGKVTYYHDFSKF